MTTNEVRARHILVNSQSQAQSLYDEISTGKTTFELAAKEYSMCPSKREGGDLGFFSRGVMVKSFEDAAFDLEIGELSMPVQTQFGWHLIEVTAKK